MNVWVEHVTDGGSTVWGCDHCHTGGWCINTTTATNEARAHARHHGIKLTTTPKPRGPKPDTERDTRITELRNNGLTLRAIALLVGITHTAVRKALRRNTAA